LAKKEPTWPLEPSDASVRVEDGATMMPRIAVRMFTAWFVARAKTMLPFVGCVAVALPFHAKAFFTFTNTGPAALSKSSNALGWIERLVK
jgi:hypothetical protein